MKKIEKGVFIRMEYAGEYRIFEVASLAIQLDHGDTVSLLSLPSRNFKDPPHLLTYNFNDYV